MHVTDSVPLAAPERGWRLRVMELLSTFLHQARGNQYLGRWVAEGIVEGQLSRQVGFCFAPLTASCIPGL